MITINVGDIYSVYGLFEVWKVMIMWLPGIYKNVSPSGVQFENSEWRLCVSGGVVLFVSLTISVVKLHNCVRNSIIQHRVCASVWVKNERKIILSGQNFLTKYAKERKTRVALSHMWDMCIYYIGSHHEIDSMGCSY